jgi:hypothetical protein
MKGDFTRNTFDPVRHFSRVLMQQGRVQLDADWNEQAAILLHYLRALAADLIGPHGGPVMNYGFALAPVPPDGKDFTIGIGHYYVDGILCENENEKVTYFNQKDYRDNYPGQTRNPLPSGKFIVYLDVWEHHITMIEDDRIREVALGGPDTGTRAKVVWQVRITDRLPKLNENMQNYWEKYWKEWVKKCQPNERGSLRVRLKPGQASADPCIISNTSAYRGNENQLYRVEIHTGGDINANPTFKWSRDNGSIAAAWLGKNDDGSLIVSNARGFGAGQWIEITSHLDDLHGVTGTFNKIFKIENDALYLDPTASWDPATPKKVRRWDQVETEDINLKDGAVPITEGRTEAETDWLDLENGIQIQFQSVQQGGHYYRTGDYWLIPARTNGTIEWPCELDDKGQPTLDAQGYSIPIAQSPHGITHHYAPLWIMNVDAEGKITLNTADELRSKFSFVK